MNYKEAFVKDIRPQVQKAGDIKNVMAVPKLEKIVINVGIGTYTKQHKKFDDVVANISQITGQKPIVQNARKAISNFKLRIGMPVGVKVTLRGKNMYNFMHKLVNIVFPRIRDFRGFSPRAFDGQGNYSVGLNDFTIFPEINPDDTVHNHGLEINIVTTAKNDEEGKLLLDAFNFPFKK